MSRVRASQRTPLIDGAFVCVGADVVINKPIMFKEERVTPMEPISGRATRCIIIIGGVYVGDGIVCKFFPMIEIIRDRKCRGGLRVVPVTSVGQPVAIIEAEDGAGGQTTAIIGVRGTLPQDQVVKLPINEIGALG
jgi:hypothetical protein